MRTPLNPAPLPHLEVAVLARRAQSNSDAARCLSQLALAYTGGNTVLLLERAHGAVGQALNKSELEIRKSRLARLLSHTWRLVDWHRVLVDRYHMLGHALFATVIVSQETAEESWEWEDEQDGGLAEGHEQGGQVVDADEVPFGS